MRKLLALCVALSTIPLLGQSITPASINKIQYVTSYFNWTQVDVAGSIGNLSVAGVNTLTLTPCPVGVNGSDTNLYIYISGVGTPEPAQVTTSGGAGTCTSRAATGTVKVTTVNTHGAGFTIGSASTGIYEALKDATATNNNNAHLNFSPTNPPASFFYTIYAPVIVAGGHIEIDGAGATIDCQASRACFLMPTANVGPVHIHGFRISTRTTYPGAQVTQTSCAANVATITTTLNPPVGRYVDVQMTRNNHYWGPHVVATTSGSSWTYTDTNCGGLGSISAQAETFAGNAPQFAFIEDNGQGNEFNDLAVDSPGGFQTNTLNNLLVILNDQKVHIHDIQLNSKLSGCTVAYCANGIYAPGNFSTNPAVLDVDNLGFSMLCAGNGITNHAGNTLRVSDSVIQGFVEWGTYSDILRGGFGGTQLDNVYNELGSCDNPWYIAAGFAAGKAQAAPGLIQGGSVVTVRGGSQPAGLIPVFASTGATQYIYYIVVHDTTVGQVSYPYEIGTATSNGAGSILVGWPQYIQTATGGGGAPTDTITYDLLRTTYVSGGGASAPFGTGNYAVATGIVQCSQAICTATDTNAALSSYTVAAETNNNLTFFWWPGSAFLSSGAQMYIDGYGPTLQQPIMVPSGWKAPTIFAHKCSSGANSSLMYVSCLGTDSSVNNAAGVSGTLLQVGPWSGAETANLKGRLNFFRNPSVSTNTGHLITLVDSSPSKTVAYFNNRPPNDANDTYLGLDSGNVSVGSAQMALGSPVAISRYIGNVGDGTNWKERLTGAADTFHVPINAFPTDNTKIPITSQCGTSAAASQSCFSVLDQGGGSVVVAKNDGSVTIGGGTTKSLSSGVAANSDMVGELTFTAATTSSTYSFTGTYTSHPECTIAPQFDPGAHRIWVSTITTATLQLSSDSAQTGNVSYICVGRD